MSKHPSRFAVAGVSHHTADVLALEAFRFGDEPAFLAAAQKKFAGALLLQTCNRVEVIVEGDAASLRDFLESQERKGFFLLEGREALRHLFSLAAGIDSMIVGEDQIIGQLKKSLADGEAACTASPFLSLCINKAVHVGVGVRRTTKINRGAVSVGSAAVLLAESELGTLEGRHILVVGSGEMGLLVAQALAAKHLTAMYVANRTFGRAVILAEKIGGVAVRMNELYHYITLSDVVISCTSAPHPVIHKTALKEAMRDRCWPVEGHPRPLILVDIAQPRDVEEGAGAIDGVRLFTIDDLRQVNEQTMSTRRAEAERAAEYVDDELDLFIRQLHRKSADDCIAALHTWAEAVRVRERDRALARLGNMDERTAGVIDDLSRVLTKKILTDATASIRACAEEGDRDAAEALVRALTRGSAADSREGTE
ncbi:Shikimate/quinate 5-dehydrogenase [Methanoregula boonei 6A8]|uniref:Glutamyl-tRNA reductase n=1 Tax=Methanoregula boonei (strain DSM 21154 / JCM 14090 / 6A8) TaxID=456442 RepID=HEM1_METB6|nr:glutamyl-tRNA reductase [Methanoregula boonei]A7I7P5.1 RecName: Full=Glutamyl-tRNA reductase; Short=GluTR [Methanoregula boonei 6A8]ABS55756.1 Shikimate/quinate 5-dehydrogenase [Methanoregula boonei 6A8]